MTRRAHGEGSYDFVKRNNTWRWRGYYRDKNGQVRRKEIVSKNKKNLRTKVESFQKNLTNGLLTENITVHRWADIWLNEICRPSTKIRTYENYACTIRNHIKPNFGKRPLKSLTPNEIQKYFNTLGQSRSPSTVITVRNHFIIMLNAASEWGYISVNPAKRTRPPKAIKAKIRALDEQETLRLLETAKKGDYIYFGAKQKWNENDGMIYLRKCYYAAIYLALASGMREGEIFGLKWENIDFKRQTIHVLSSMVTTRKHGEILTSPKTATSARAVLIPQKAVKVLQEWKQYQKQYADKWGDIFQNPHALVFTNSYGNMVSISNFMKRYFRKMIAVAIGENEAVRFHDLRHTHASQLLRAGVNIKVISERLGHSSVSVTMNIYSHLLPGMQETAVAQLEKLFQ